MKARSKSEKGLMLVARSRARRKEPKPYLRRRLSLLGRLRLRVEEVGARLSRAA